MLTHKLSIGGMTCINCQNKIEQALKRVDGVEEVSVSYKDGIARFAYDSDIVSLEKIVSIIEELDYKVLPEQQRPDIIRVISFLAIIIALFVILQQFGLLNLLVPSQLADSGMGYGMLFLVGVFTSVHCIAMCGGIGLSQCLPQVDKAKFSFLPSVLYNLGRVVSYTAVGFLLGFIGMLIGGGSEVGIPVLLQGVLKLAAGVIMVIMGINMLGIFPWLRRFNLKMPNFIAKNINTKKAKSSQPFVVGLLNGLMPCGPLQSMQILALASGNPFTGAVSMLLFSLGTTPLMLGLGTLVAALGRKFAHAVMNVGAVLVAVLGLAMLSQGGSLSGMLFPDRLLFIVIGLAVIGIAASIPVPKKIYRGVSIAVSVVAVAAAGLVLQGFEGRAAVSEGSTVQIIDGVQTVNSVLAPGQYPTVMVQAGMPVKWIINAPEGSVNGCNYKMIIRDYGIEYSFEEGENIIEFMPDTAGNVAYTCWMGMIQGTIIVTE